MTMTTSTSASTTAFTIRSTTSRTTSTSIMTPTNKPSTSITSHIGSTSLNAAAIQEKIENLETMTSSITTVTEKIDSITSARSLRSLSCSEFIELVTSFNSIADTISEVDNIQTLATEIENSSVAACSDDELSSLSSLQSSLTSIQEDLESTIENLQNILSGMYVVYRIFFEWGLSILMMFNCIKCYRINHNFRDDLYCINRYGTKQKWWFMFTKNTFSTFWQTHLYQIHTYHSINNIFYYHDSQCIRKGKLSFP